jgi:hypothetical protein
MALDTGGGVPRAGRLEAAHRAEGGQDELGERQLVDPDEREEELRQHEAA